MCMGVCVLLLPLGSDTDRARREHEALVRSLDATRAELARTKDELVAKAAKLDAREAATAEREQASMRMKEEVKQSIGLHGFIWYLAHTFGWVHQMEQTMAIARAMRQDVQRGVQSQREVERSVQEAAEAKAEAEEAALAHRKETEALQNKLRILGTKVRCRACAAAYHMCQLTNCGVLVFTCRRCT